jgi:hypothetical protein
LGVAGCVYAYLGKVSDPSTISSVMPMQNIQRGYLSGLAALHASAGVVLAI